MAPALVQALVHVVERLDVPAGVDRVVRLARDQDGSSEGWLRRAAGQLGMRASDLRASLDEVLAAMPGDVALTVQPGAPDRVWVVWPDGAITAFPETEVRATPAVARAELGEALRTFVVLERVLVASPPGADGFSSRLARTRLSTILAAERSDLVAIVVYAVAVGILSLATPLAIQVLINWLGFGGLQQPLIALSGALLVFLSMSALFRTLLRIAAEMVQRRVFLRMVRDLTMRLVRVRVEAFDRAWGPGLLNRFFDVLTVQKAVQALFVDGFSAALQAAVGMVLLAVYHPLLLAYSVVLGAAAAIVIVVLARGAGRTALKESKAKYAVAEWLEELARDPVAFKLGGQRLAEEQSEIRLHGYLAARRAHFRVVLRQVVGALGVQVIASVALLALGGSLVLGGQLTLGQLVAAEFVVTAALAGLVKFTEKLEVLYDLLAAADKLGTLVELPVERNVGVPVDGQGPMDLELRRVGFRWPEGATVLHDVELRLAPGDSVAIVGAPGSGKTVLADLILGLRRPGAGVVRWEGRDLQSIQPDDAFRAAFLLRAGAPLAATVEDNLLLGQGVATGEVWEALARVGLRDDVEALPAGLETLLAPSGAPLARTQAQLLGLARLLLHEPRLVVVDGWLDTLPAAQQDVALDLLCSRGARWTLVVLTADARVGRRCGRKLHLHQGTLDADVRAIA